jgi:opacity protein-like surface antigen
MKNLFFLLFTLLPIALLSNANDSTHTRKIIIGINFSPDYNYRKLKADEASQSIATYRDTIEIAKNGYTTGLSLNYRLHKKTAIEVGLLFSDKGEKTKKYLLDNSPNGKLPIYNTFVYHYYYLDIPIRANFYFTKGKLQLYATAGVSANIFLTKQTTSILEYSYKSSEKTKSYDTKDISKLNFALLAGIGVNYLFKKNIAFKIEPLYRRSINAISPSPIKEYFYSFGINFGVSIQL